MTEQEKISNDEIVLRTDNLPSVNDSVDGDYEECDSNRSSYDLQLEETGIPVTKQMIWERKLLDFSLRNNLLNTRLGRKVVPFISFDIEYLEDHLQNGEDYFITPSPGKKLEPNADGMYDSKQQAADYRTLVSERISDHRIASYLTEAELQNALKYVYRTARTSMEENGANSLFLALGMLKWYENSKSEQPRYAPILLLPVDIIRKSGNNYVIRKRDEDMILNITLVELLKQNFRINLDVLKDLPKDESGVDVKLVFNYFRKAIEELNRWTVVEESMLGPRPRLTLRLSMHSPSTTSCASTRRISRANRLLSSSWATRRRLIPRLSRRNWAARLPSSRRPSSSTRLRRSLTLSCKND